MHLIARSKSDDLVEATAEALGRLSGAYSLVIMNERELLGIRDPHGLRPLSLGQARGCVGPGFGDRAPSI